MSDALAKYRRALAKYRKEHKDVPYAKAQQEVSKMMHEGKVSGVKKKKRKVSGTSHKTAIGKAKKRTTTRRAKVSGTAAKTIGRVEQGEKLIREINALERKRARLKHRELQDLVQLEINSCHDKLDRIKNSYKRKSA